MGSLSNCSVPFPRTFLLQGFIHAQPVYADDIAHYANLRFGEQFASDLERNLPNVIAQRHPWLAILEALSVLPKVGCPSELWTLAGSQGRYERLYALRAVFAQCEAPEEDPRLRGLERLLRADSACLAELVRHGILDPSELVPHLAAETEVETKTAILEALGWATYFARYFQILGHWTDRHAARSSSNVFT